ncbi:MAG: hypothetical protein HYV27_05090 [Candidatus Hydrogenedentes bacterium]|nr:hypothetical protein [Candidatus Hydrogenedentota bacterium]
MRFVLMVALAGLCAPAGAAPLRDYTWQLHHPDWPRMEDAIRRAAASGATEIQLSHGIIEAVDQIVQDPNTAELVRKTAALCDELGMQTSVWAQELNIGKNQVAQDLDPAGGGAAMWAARQAAYKGAFEAIPSVDRVVLQFGSCPTEIWYVRNDVSAFNAATPCAERIALTIAKVKEVCDAFGKGLDVRTFDHSPEQHRCMQEGLKRVQGVRAMIKEVPQDWQPYYPLDYLIGDVGENESYVEFDLGAEYWGRSAVPFPMVDYLAWRIRAMALRGITGVVVRVERGNDAVLGTLNELNVFAVSALVKDPSASGAAIQDQWITVRFGVAAESREAVVLRGIFRDFFEAGRKMFYVRHHWALEKSSSIPDKVETAMLSMKNLPQWNPEYTEDWKRMKSPDAALVVEIWQEKSEAVALIERAQAQFETVAASLRQADAAVLQEALEDYARYTRLWRAVTDGIFRVPVYRKGKADADQAWLEADARYIESQTEVSGQDLALAPKERLASFVKDLRRRFPACAPADVDAPPLPGPLRMESVSGKLQVSWMGAPGLPAAVEFTTRLPRWEQHVDVPATADGAQQVTLADLPAQRPLFLRVKTVQGVSGEYWYFD